jgi:NAD(P)-dependent dehydrogenase (short-subunit alcohol dehydrogenase family)
MTTVDRGLFDLTGKVALITGGNAGLGYGYAKGIARHGGDLVIWGRRSEKNEAVADELREYGVRVLAQSVDVSDEQQVVSGMADAIEQMGRLDCVIANAGISGRRGPFDTMSTEDYRSVIAVSQDGAFFTIREAVRHMVARAESGDPGGSIIATGSLTMLLGRPYRQQYAAAKAAVLAMIRGIAVEYAAQGIRANVVAAGRVHTEIASTAGSLVESMEQLVADVPMKRFGTIDELAGAVVYLMSDAASYHTGDLIVVDGGLSIA